jgi:N-acetylhexosamine 1-kinase
VDTISRIIDHFFVNIKINKVTTLHSGLINSTFKIDADQGEFILQKINQKVFPNCSALLNNKEKVIQYLKEVGFPTINYIPNKEGLSYTYDGEELWQLSVYIPSIIKEKISNPIIAEKSGTYLANFHRALLDFPIDELEYTLPDFHNTLKRFNDFQESIKDAHQQRIEQAKESIVFLTTNFNVIKDVASKINSRIIPLRVVHNDTKVGNMLFNKNEDIICIIDFDTIMPGSILHDIGDALRTGTNTSSENERDLTKVKFDIEIYESFMKGYNNIANSFLTKEELNNIHLSLPLILFEQACRFLGDYLNNDRYYNTDYENQNLIRAKTQIRLFEQAFSYLKL